MINCEAGACFVGATHVLVDRYHQIIEETSEQANDGLYFCESHAFTDGREQCSVCEKFSGHTLEVEDAAGNLHLLKRTYPAGTLDSDGGCSDH